MDAAPDTAAASLFDEIRAACAGVAARARSVRIDDARLAAVAEALPAGAVRAPGHDGERHVLGQGDATLAFFLVLDAVNFGSGWFPHLRKLPGCSGYFTIASHLTRRHREQGPFTAEELAALDAAACARLFGQEGVGPPIDELLALFARALNDLGALLLRRYSGRFPALVEDAGGSAARLVALLARMPLYRDVSEHDGRPVPFYKRAQLTAADLALAFGGRGPGAFHDLSRLTIFADNLVPHVLRVDGVLVYDPGLAARIDAGELLVAGSPEEVEIRACAVHAAERMLAVLARQGRAATAADLDMLLWNRGQQPEYKARPRHRARCPYY